MEKQLASRRIELVVEIKAVKTEIEKLEGHVNGKQLEAKSTNRT